MSIALTPDVSSFYRDRLQRGLDLASVRQLRLDRELIHLTDAFGAASPETLRAQDRRDRQAALVDALQDRIDLLDEVYP